MSNDRCKQCGAEVIWAGLNSNPTSRAPLDARPVRRNYGNIDLDATRMTYVVLEPEVAENARARGFELYTNHLGTCPARERHGSEVGGQRSEPPAVAGGQIESGKGAHS